LEADVANGCYLVHAPRPPIETSIEMAEQLAPTGGSCHGVEIAKALLEGGPPPAGLSPDEKIAYEGMDALYKQGSGYAGMMVTRPQTIGYSLADSPVGLAAWFYDEFADWTYSGGEPERSLTRDEMLDDITLYWLTNTGTSGARLYWENNANNFNAVDISLPAAITVFPGEIYQAPRSWASGPTTSSSTPTRSTRAVTSGPGRSRNCSPRSYERRSGHCASRRAAGRRAGCARRPPLLHAESQMVEATNHHTSFGPLRQVEAGLLNVGYADIGPGRRSCGRSSARLAIRHSQLCRHSPPLGIGRLQGGRPVPSRLWDDTLPVG
jgi:hypothetical protein